MPKFPHPECEHCKSRKSSLLHFCHLEEIAEVESGKNCSVYKKGETLFQENNHPVGMYCVNTGKIKIYKYASDGHEHILRIAKPGDFVGYRSLLSDSIYPVSASAMEESTVCIIPKSMITGLMRKNERFAEGMLQMLCNAIDESYDKMADLAYKPVRGRMAEALLFLKKFYTEENNPAGVITISREDLASFVGTVKETAIRTLKEFKEEGMIETQKSDILVKDMQQLLKVSELYD